MADDVTNLDDKKVIEQLKREIIALKRENVAAMQTIQKLLKDLNKKTEENAQIQEMLAQNVPVITKETPKIAETISAEEEIADYQLEKLRNAARTRSLTLEEVRMYDLLVKNKRLGQGKSTENHSKGEYREIDVIELMKIAPPPKTNQDEK